jgi:hypothetical protein
MSWFGRVVLPSACVLAVAACTTSGSEDAGAEIDVQSGSLGLVSVERFVDGESLPRLIAGAKIARYRGIPGDALLELLGAAPRELETCKLEGGLNGLAVGPEARVQLVPVGDISIRLGDSVTTLTPRVFPALASTASGYFYAGDTEIVVPRAELDEYLISARGETGLGAFEMVAAAPGELAGLGFDGTRVEANPAFVRGHDLSLSWEPEDPRDSIELEIYTGGSVLSCACRDDGQFTLGAEELASLESDEHASLVVRRVRILPIELSGIQTAYARIATTRTLDALVK